MTTVDLGALATVSGVATVVTILTQVILNAANLSDDNSNRWGPLLALVLGIIVGEIGAFALGTATSASGITLAGYTGLLGGATAIALHAVFVKSAIGAVIGSALGITPAPPKVTGLQIQSQVKAQ